MAELVELDVTGQLRRTLLASGGSKRILDVLGTSPSAKTARG
jgi:hypothetical protein